MEPTLRSLSERELQVAGMVAWGYSIKEIADKLCISSLTVRAHVKNIYRSSGCRKSTDLARVYILENGFKVPVFEAKKKARPIQRLLRLVREAIANTRQNILYKIIMQS